jgi:hypothetical protein
MLKAINAAIRRLNARQVEAIRKEYITMKDDVRYALRMWTICVLMPCLALVIIGVIACATAKADTPTRSTDHVCFAASQWGPAPDAVRPCVTIGIAAKPLDSLVWFKVKDADGTVRYSGYVNTPFDHAATARVTRLAEDGSFTYIIVNHAGAAVSASVGNLEG